jgi:predicted  nucleic acid-binding Zn-ribbon protein
MHPDLEKLLDLQSKDNALKAVDTALAEVLAAETALDDRLKRAERDVETSTRSAAEATSRRDDLMRRVEEYKVQQQRRQSRLDQVKNMKEANAVTAEIDLGRQVLAREEAEWLQVAEELGRLDTKQAAAVAVLAEARAAQEGERSALNARRAALEAERGLAFAARSESAGKLDRPLRTRYDRLHNSKSANALVPLSGFSCSVCFTAVPISRRAHIKDRLLIDGCEVCGAILYLPAPVEGTA